YEAIRNEFKGRKAEAAELNVAAVRSAAAYARSHFATKPERRLLPVPVAQRKSRMLIKGFQAVGIAKLKAGLGMQPYYPISPAHGDFPHIVVASGDIDEAFVDSFESFNWADRYQMPVVVLLEKFLASSMFTSDGIDMSKLKIDRGLIHQPVDADGDSYRRHALTADGISPRTIPGMPGGIFSTTSDEHDPEGHITEGIENRIAMMRKRMAKLETAAR